MLMKTFGDFDRLPESLFLFLKSGYGCSELIAAVLAPLVPSALTTETVRFKGQTNLYCPHSISHPSCGRSRRRLLHCSVFDFMNLHMHCAFSNTDSSEM